MRTAKLKRWGRCVGMAGVWVLGWVAPGAALAGGGGENMLLIVNPKDEQAVRVANAYVKARNIPVSNVLFIEPPKINGLYNVQISEADYISRYVQPIQNHLAAKNLLGQIDYIGAIGGPNKITLSYKNAAGTTTTGYASVDRALSYQGIIANNLTSSTNINDTVVANLVNSYSPLFSFYASHGGDLNPSGNNPTPPASLATPYTRGSNAAIHATTNYDSYSTTGLTRVDYMYSVTPIVGGQFYLAGHIAYTGMGGNTPREAVSSFERAVAADGTKPQGTVYFEQNTDIRTTTRSPQWPDAQAELASRGIAYVQEQGIVPTNRTNVRGAVVGSASYYPTRSSWLAGSWGDSLTSYGATYVYREQSHASEFIRAGAAASAGTVMEPYATPMKFPNAMIYSVIDDGSTLAEAMYKSVALPTQIMFQGDMLAQPYADVPKVTLAGVNEGQSVSGSVNLTASATLTNPKLATDITGYKLYVDGVLKNSSADGSFALDTAGLSDGRHEVRVVAVNNAAAESQGYILRNVTVNNRGRSTQAGVSALALDARQVGSVTVTTQTGGSAVSRVELRSLGRTLGTLSGAGGAVSLDASLLAYGANIVVPVAVFSDGTETAGTPLTVTRNTPAPWAGRTPTAVGARIAGCRAEYFLGKGAATADASDFSGTPDYVVQTPRINLWSGLADADKKYTYLNAPAPDAMPTTAIDKLAVKMSGRFDVTPATAGEWQFYFYWSNDSVSLYIDGNKIAGFTTSMSSTPTETTLWADSLFLAPGEHDLMLLASNTVETGYSRANYFDISLMYRNPDGITRLADSSLLYTVVPEPVSLGILSMLVPVLCGRSMRRRCR